MYSGRVCYLCGRNGSTDPIDSHHIFSGGLRKKSDKYGLVVDLCHHRCHQFGPNSAHQNAKIRDELHKYGQRKAMHEQGWSVQEFIYEFGKNYLSDNEIEEFYADESRSYGESGFEVRKDIELPY